jgi:hypothetical protein
MGKRQNKRKKERATAATDGGKTGAARSAAKTRVAANSRVAPREEESRGAEALTVALILAAMATLLAEGVVAGARIALLIEPKLRDLEWMQALPRVMLLVSATTGVICLVMNPIVSRVRRLKLPLVVTVGINLCAITPLIAILVIWFVS